MQVQDKRACKACGASNAPDAAFCWQCLARFDMAAAGPGMPPAPVSATQPVGYGRPGMAPPLNVPSSISATTKGGSGRAGKIAIGLVVAAVLAFVGNRMFGAPDYHVPATINGVARATDPSAKALEASLSEEAKKYDVTIDTGIYGSSSAPDFMVIVLNGRAVESSDSLFSSLTDGMASAGATIDGAPVTGTHDGADYRCVLVHGGSASATACMWRDHDNVGMVLDPGASLKEGEQLLWTARDAVVG